MSITQNCQAAEMLQAMAAAAFPGRGASTFTGLTGGMFNAACRCEFADGAVCVLKIAPSGTQGAADQRSEHHEGGGLGRAGSACDG